MEHCFKFLTFEIFPSSLSLILVLNKIIGILQYKTNPTNIWITVYY